MKTLIIFAAIIGVCFVGGKTALSYADKFTLVSSLDAVDFQKGLSKKSIEDIKAIVINEVNNNGVKFVKPEDIFVKQDKTEGYIEVGYKYIARVNLLGDIGFDLKMETDPRKLKDQ